MSSGTIQPAVGKHRAVSATPLNIDESRHVELAGRRKGIYWRRGMILLLGAFIALGLANTFGQRPQHQTVNAAAASLEIFAPSHVRGGLLYEGRFTISAHRALRHAVLQFGPGWAESMQINTIEPSPVNESTHD